MKKWFTQHGCWAPQVQVFMEPSGLLERHSFWFFASRTDLVDCAQTGAESAVNASAEAARIARIELFFTGWHSLLDAIAKGIVPHPTGRRYVVAASAVEIFAVRHGLARQHRL